MFALLLNACGFGPDVPEVVEEKTETKKESTASDSAQAVAGDTYTAEVRADKQIEWIDNGR